MIVLNGWQLVGIILGSIWLGGMIGLFTGCALSMASRADDELERGYYEPIPD